MMNKSRLNKQSVVRFKHFANRRYSLFSVLGKVVVISTLSVMTLQYATAGGRSIEAQQVSLDSTVTDISIALEEIEVMATRSPLSAPQQARMVTILTKEEIQRAPVQSVNDLLKYAAGVDVRQKGPLGALTDVSIRGGHSEQIAVLLNGINICDAQTGHNTFDFPVDLSEIERIEVLEGPSGRVYGTSSLLGAINIVTKTPPTTSLTAHAAGGSYGYFDAGARANLANGKWNNQLSTSFLRSDGYLRNTNGGLNADYKTTKAFYQGNYSDALIAVRWHAGMSLKDFGANNFYSSKYDNQFEHTFKTYTAIQAETKQGAIHLRPSVYWNRSKDRFELFREAPDKYPFNYHRTDVFGVNLNAYFDWLWGRTALGAELRHEAIVSTNLGEKLDTPIAISGTNQSYAHGLNRTNLQFIIEHNVILNRFTLSAGFIAVKNSQANMSMRLYPGVDASYRIGSDWKVYASYNSSLRMPSFTELFYSVGGHKADKHLRPEELSAIEGGVKYDSRYAVGKASLFYNRYRNLIDWISDGTLDDTGAILWKSVNFGRINALGVQATLDLNLLNIFPSQHTLKKVELGYTYLNQSAQEQPGIVSKYALEYLRHKFVAGVQINLWRQLDLGLNYRFQQRMGSYIDKENAKHDYAGYGVLDARLSWNAPRWSLYVAGNNLLNKRYVDYGNVPQPGIWVMSGISVTIE